MDALGELGKLGFLRVQLIDEAGDAAGAGMQLLIVSAKEGSSLFNLGTTIRKDLSGLHRLHTACTPTCTWILRSISAVCLGVN